MSRDTGATPPTSQELTMGEREERAALVDLFRRLVCEAVAGQTRPDFLCKTPAKANAVLAFAFANLAAAIERGDHRKNEDDDGSRKGDDRP